MDAIKNGRKEADFSSYVEENGVDIEEPTSFLDHVYLGCTRRECKPNEKIIGQYNKMFESHLSAGATEKLPGWDKPRAKTSAWSYDMEGHARKCVDGYCELSNKTEVSSPCLDDHQIKKEEMEHKGELSEVCSHVVLECFYLARICRPDQSTNWHDLSQNGLKHVTDDWHD